MGFVQRAFTIGGGEAPEAVAQREAASAQQAAAPPAVQAAPKIPEAPAPPKAPGFFEGQAPAARQRAQITGTSLLGAAAATGQTARKSASVLG